MKLDAMTLGKMETQLKQWNLQIETFTAKSDDPGTTSPIDFRKHIDNVKSQCKATQERLDEIKAAGCFRWQVYEPGIIGTWKKLDNAFKRLSEEDRGAGSS
jgi:hypothetical protein